jgi:hypothetical protein
VAEDERQLRLAEFAVADVQVGSADTAGVHVHQHLPGARLGDRQLDSLERPTG